MPLRVLHTPDRIAVCREGQNVPLAVQNAPANKRPFLHPILAPDCSATLTENAPTHHAWQHGLYIGLNDVNGVGFWTEGLNANCRNEGSFHPLPLKEPVALGQGAAWRVRTVWRGPNGATMIDEIQYWTLKDRGYQFTLDLEWILRARIDLTFGKYAYGGLFLRMPFNPETGASALNSEGARNLAAEGQRARWVAVCMPIPRAGGERTVAGMAIMDHPTNPEHPVPYRIDSQYGISPSRCIAGAWNLKADDAVTFKHRVLVFSGEADAERINENWQDWSSTA